MRLKTDLLKSIVICSLQVLHFLCPPDITGSVSGSAHVRVGPWTSRRHAPDPSLKLIFVNLGFCSTGWLPLTGMELQTARQWFETKRRDITTLPLTGTLEMRAIFHYLSSSTVRYRHFFSRFQKSQARNRQHNVSTTERFLASVRPWTPSSASNR